MSSSDGASGPDPSETLDALIERLMNLCFYGPLGMVWERDAILEQLVKRGRSQTQLAKFAAQYAAQYGPDEVEERLAETLAGFGRQLAGPLGRLLVEIGVALGPIGPQPTQPGGARADEEPLPGYDGLTAREVVDRLRDLDPEDQARVYTYERGHKARKTILRLADR